jgi:hypothetical protein
MIYRDNAIFSMNACLLNLVEVIFRDSKKLLDFPLRSLAPLAERVGLVTAF